MTALCFIDCESTGLDPRIHQPYEVAWMLEDDERVSSINLPHDLTHADPVALDIGHYYERRMHEKSAPADAAKYLAHKFRGVTLVGSNPGFDAAMLTRVIGHAPWHYRMIDVAQAGMWMFGWDRPRGLNGVVEALIAFGAEIPEPDHTAAGDVRTTRAVYDALNEMRQYPRRVVMGTPGTVSLTAGMLALRDETARVDQPRRLCDPIQTDEETR